MGEQPSPSRPIPSCLSSVQARISHLQNITHSVIFPSKLSVESTHRKAGPSMTGQDLREARRKKGWTQEETAEKLGVTQAYLSMLESGRRAMPYTLARRAAETLDAPPTALPLRASAAELPVESEKLSLKLTALGYPGFAPLRESRIAQGRQLQAQLLTLHSQLGGRRAQRKGRWR